MEIIDYTRGDITAAIIIERGSFTASTPCESRKFKTMKGAVKFMEAKGYKQRKPTDRITEAQYYLNCL